MPKAPKPYPKGKFYCTSYGGRKHHKLCPLAEGLKQAQLELARLMLSSQASPAPTTEIPGLTLGDAVKRYLEFCQVETSPGTYSWYQDKLKHLEDRLGARPLDSITYADALSYKKYLMEERQWLKGKVLVKGLKPTSVNNCLRAAKTFFSWCCRPSRQLLRLSPWDEINYLTERGRERLLTEEEFQSLLEECRDGSIVGSAQDFREELTLLRYTTLRPGELRCCKWAYLDYITHRIVFPDEVIKVRKRREVTLLDIAEKCLQERFSRLKPSLDSHLFPINGAEQSAQTFSRRFGRLFNRCVKLGKIEKLKNGERLCLYTNRHTRISQLVGEGHTLPVIMFEAGHTTPKTTMRYVHLQGSDVAQQIRNKHTDNK